MSTGGCALQLLGIDKRFGTTVALDNAAIAVQSGTLHMLLGENGAGKTTLLHVAVGNVRPDSGTIILNGQSVRWRSRSDALAAGLSAVYQHFSLVPAMTVAENVALSALSLTARYTARTAADEVRRICDASGLNVNPETVVGDLPVAAQQRVEIIKAIARDAPVLMLDEPTAVLSPPEATDLYRWLRQFVASGRTVLVITHKIREALHHGDAVTVLRHGRTVLSAAMNTVDEQVVLAAILGETLNQDASAKIGNRGRPLRSDPAAVIQLRDVTVVDASGAMRLAPLSITVHAGEIVGVAGVDGAGQHELLRVLSGRQDPSSGTVSLPQAVGYVPEDRLRDAIVPELSLVENLAIRGAGARSGLIDWNVMAAATHLAMATFDVRGANTSASADSLSGGNQQKFVLARELADSPTALVAENPTRGLDVRAAADVLDRIRAARDAGAAVVLYSSDLDELLSVADRILVCYAGTVHESSLDADAIGAAMVGAR